MVANVWFAGQLVMWSVGSRADIAATLYTDNGGTTRLVGTCQLTDTWDLGFVRVIRLIILLVVLPSNL